MSKIYYGGYGHNPSGKLYEYEGDDNFRTGQNVLVEAEHSKSGKLFKTMFTILKTSLASTEIAQKERERLFGRGIQLKKIIGTDVLSELPSGHLYETKKAWKTASDERYMAAVRTRLLGRGNER